MLSASDPLKTFLCRVGAVSDAPAVEAMCSHALDALIEDLGADRGAVALADDGGVVAVRASAGLDVALGQPWLPFFISWEVPPERHPGRMPAEHRARPEGIAWVRVGCEAAELGEWLGGESLPVRFEGPPGVNALGIAAGGAEIVIP